jgi:hypothetical protein
LAWLLEIGPNTRPLYGEHFTSTGVMKDFLLALAGLCIIAPALAYPDAFASNVTLHQTRGVPFGLVLDVPAHRGVADE